MPVVSFLILVLKCPGTSSSRDNSNYFQGSYAELEDSICQPCGPGTVQPDAAKTSCNLCPVGQVPDSERTNCVPCGEVNGPDEKYLIKNKNCVLGSRRTLNFHPLHLDLQPT